MNRNIPVETTMLVNIRRMRSLDKKKHATMLGAIHKHFGSLAEVVGQGAGLHIVLQLSEKSFSEKEILRRAEQKGIRLLPFSWTCASAESDTGKLMLGCGGLSMISVRLATSQLKIRV